MELSEKILSIIQDTLPFNEENQQSYFDMVDNLHVKILNLLPVKTVIDPVSLPAPNTPLWLWHKGSNKPILANFRTDYPNPLFWEIVDGDYMNSSNAIPLERATHYMYVNEPE